MQEKKYEDVEREFWNPEKVDDAVVGIYLNFEENVGSNKSMVFNLEQPNGRIISIWGSTVLDNKMKLLKFGDDIKIIYLGERKGEKNKRTYKDFKIQKVQKAETQKDF